MKLNKIHSWNLSVQEAIRLQKKLAPQVVKHPPDGFNPRLIAAADISSNRFSKTLYAAVVVMTFPALEIVEEKTGQCEALFPYVPGLLSFRELPALEKVFAEIEHEPDAVLMDGQGMAHPRRFGLACHAGLMLECPTIGSAKSLLAGAFQPPGENRGSFSPIIHENEVVGQAVRTKNRTNPVFVSIGHLMDLATARDIIINCSLLRIPEPLRAAHIAANNARKKAMTQPLFDN